MDDAPMPSARRIPKLYRRYYSYALSGEDKEALKSRPSPPPKRGSAEVIEKARSCVSAALSLLDTTKDSVQDEEQQDEEQERQSLIVDQEARDQLVTEIHRLTPVEVSTAQTPAYRATPARRRNLREFILEKNAYREFQDEYQDVQGSRTPRTSSDSQGDNTPRASNEAQRDLTPRTRKFLDDLPTFPSTTPPDSPPAALTHATEFAALTHPTEFEDNYVALKNIPRRKNARRRRPQSVPSMGSVQTPRPFQRNSSVTFDSMLTTHVTGKGEAYRGAENAKKDEEDGRRGLFFGRGYNIPGRGQRSRSASG